MRRERLLVGALVLVLAVSLAACGGDSSSSSGTPTSNTVTMSGSLDSSTMTFASKEGPFKRFLALLHPFGKAYAVGETVDNIVAISPDKTFITATKNGNDFSLSLTKGKPYMITFLRGTTIVGLYKVDDTTGMDSLPISTDSGDISVGTVSLSAGVALGSLSSSSLLQTLGITQSVASAYGVMDDGMTRLSSVDVDGNGTIDYQENKSYKLYVSYGFRYSTCATPSSSPGTAFTNSEGKWSDKDLILACGYEYNFVANPDVSSLDWDSAILNLPAAVDGVTSKLQGYNGISSFGRDVEFWPSGSEGYATNPSTPPSGTYTITVNSATGGSATTYTYKNVRSQTIDANLNNIYVPITKLTLDGSGKVTLLEWQWWKKLNNTWTQPSNDELATVLDFANFEIMTTGTNDEVEGSIGLTSSGSVTPLSQSFTPNRFGITYGDKAGYAYQFGDM
jgi:hypothetical protein